MSYRQYVKLREQYTIGAFAKLFGVGVDTLRYYEEKGLLIPKRGNNGYRYYTVRSVWRMNVIMNLRKLGFSINRIRIYFRDRTVKSTAALLEEELVMIHEKIADLEELQKSVLEQKTILDESLDLPLEKVRCLALPPRQAFVIFQPYDKDEDMDLLMRRLLDCGENTVFMIGNNRMASILAPDDADHQFDGAMMFDDKGTYTLQGGNYLSVCYSGATDSRRHADLLQQYAEKHGFTVLPPFIDQVWIDIHTSENECEHVSELQVRIKKI